MSTQSAGLSVNVYRRSGEDCTLNRISSTAETLIVVGAYHRDEDRLFALTPSERLSHPSAQEPAAMIQVRGHGRESSAVLVPAQFDEESGTYRPVQEWTMAGGNFAFSHDSRFSDLIRRALGRSFYGALPIHDRVER